MSMAYSLFITVSKSKLESLSSVYNVYRVSPGYSISAQHLGKMLRRPARPSPGAGSKGTIKTVSLGRPWLGWAGVGYGCKYIPAQLSASKADHGHVIENCSVDLAHILVRCNVLTGSYHEMAAHYLCRMLGLRTFISC